MSAAQPDSQISTLTKAVIYARVSSVKQKVEGTGLESQVTRCEGFAKAKGYEVIRSFKDDISGGSVDRPAMSEMLAFLRSKKKTPHVVIIDDISRLARGLEAHIQLRASIAKAGGVLESPSLTFGEGSDDQLVENLLAVVSQHQRQKNGEQVLNRMKARVMNGYWVKRAPLGYRYVPVRGRGKMLERHEPMASIIASVFEGFANGRFESQAEVLRYLETLPHFPRDGRGMIRNSRIREMLQHPIYAGLVHAPKWGVSLREGQHEGLISQVVFERVQEKLTRKPVVPAKANTSADFVLRGAVACTDCGWKLTSCWSKGRAKRYPYYLCGNKGCDSFGKSTNRDKLEVQVEGLLKELEPDPVFVASAMQMFETAWNALGERVEDQRKDYASQINDAQGQIDKLINRLIETDNSAIMGALEGKIAKLEQKKLALAEKRDANAPKNRDFDAHVRTALQFLLNPLKVWENGNFNARRMVLRLAFGEHLEFRRDTGVRTAQKPYLFQVIQSVSDRLTHEIGDLSKMVPASGQSLNQLFDTLAEWETLLKQLDVDHLPGWGMEP